MPLSQSLALAVICWAASVLIVFFFTRGLAHRTTQGTRVLAELRGFQEFLDTVDADRLRRVPPERLESFLPYAVALGVEHHWAENFSHIATGKPEWFEGANAADAVGMVHYVAWFARAAGSLMLRAPRGAAAQARPPAPASHAGSAAHVASPRPS